MTLGPALPEMTDAIDRILRPLISPEASYALLDFPTHCNIGDSAIYAGEIAVLDRLVGRPAVHVSSRRTPVDVIRRIDPDTLLLLHGGGNFGDIWLPYQRYREAVLTACTEHRIVQLPQSIHFRDEAERDRTARAIAAHPNFTLLVRDRPSFDLAQAHFDCETILCPDMAFGLAPVPIPNVSKKHETLCLIREDAERHEGMNRSDFDALGDVVDWPIYSDPISFPVRMGFRLTAGIAHGPRAMKLRELAFRRYARWMTERGLRLLASAEHVVTDRLHGHILSTLIGKPHVTLDNSYGKISRFMAAWPKDPYTLRAETFDEVREALRSLST